MKLNKLLFLFFSFCSLSLVADDEKNAFDSANVAYSKGDYEKAIKLYGNTCSLNSESIEVYYNLGNTYFKIGKLGLAILNYERAKKLSPNDDDINSNLKFANQKIEDKIDTAPQLFLTEWKNGIVKWMSEKYWSIGCILFLILSLSFFAVYIITSKKLLKQLSFYIGFLLVFITIITFFIAKHKNTLELNSTEAIIISPSVTIAGSPNEKGTKLFLLHEGTKVVIMEENGDWTEIKIANGNTGWLKNSSIQKI